MTSNTTGRSQNDATAASTSEEVSIQTNHSHIVIRSLAHYVTTMKVFHFVLRDLGLPLITALFCLSKTLARETYFCIPDGPSSSIRFIQDNFHCVSF